MVGIPHCRGNNGQWSCRKSRRNAGDDPEAKTGARQRQNFFAAAPEHKGVTAFETQNAPPHPGAFDQKLIDIALLSRWLSPALARKDQFGLVAGKFQNAWIDQSIVNDVVSRPQRVERMECQKSGVARASPCKPDLARWKSREVRKVVEGKLRLHHEPLPRNGR